MDAIEKAIRGAFEKGDADNRAFREKIYRSAFAALDRALQANPNASPDVVEKKRNDLQAKIVEIETEFIPAVAMDDEPPAAAPPASPVAPTPPVAPSVALDRSDSAAPPRSAQPPVAPSIELDQAAVARPARNAAPQEPVAPSIELDRPAEAPSGRAEPQHRAEPAFGPGPAEPAFDPGPAEVAAGPVEPRFADPRFAELAGDPADGRPLPEPFFPDASDFGAPGSPVPEPFAAADDEVSAADGPNVASERRRPLAAIFLGVTLLALAAVGAWWAISTGLVKIPGPPEENVITEAPPEEEEFTPGEEAAPARPGEADAERNWITVFSPADPSRVSAPGGTKAEVLTDDDGSYMRIRSGAAGSAIMFDVPQGALEQIAGKHAVFDIVARAEEGKETQFSVDCNFGELGDCGRKRYPAGYTKTDFLFDIDMPAKAPGSDGTIAINTDVDNAGKAIDVFEIKVSVSQ